MAGRFRSSRGSQNIVFSNNKGFQSPNSTLAFKKNGSGEIFFGGATQSRTGLNGFAIHCITALLSRHQAGCIITKNMGKPEGLSQVIWSGKRDSNSRPIPWQGIALPTELFPQKRSPHYKEIELRVNKLKHIFCFCLQHACLCIMRRSRISEPAFR
jgi:hypothetical protein